MLQVLLDPSELAKVTTRRKKPLTPAQIARVRRMQVRIDREVAASLASKRQVSA